MLLGISSKMTRRLAARLRSVVGHGLGSIVFITIIGGCATLAPETPPQPHESAIPAAEKGEMAAFGGSVAERFGVGHRDSRGSAGRRMRSTCALPLLTQPFSLSM